MTNFNIDSTNNMGNLTVNTIPNTNQKFITLIQQTTKDTDKLIVNYQIRCDKLTEKYVLNDKLIFIDELSNFNKVEMDFYIGIAKIISTKKVPEKRLNKVQKLYGTIRNTERQETIDCIKDYAKNPSDNLAKIKDRIKDFKIKTFEIREKLRTTIVELLEI